jgi:hypothetical protein
MTHDPDLRKEQQRKALIAQARGTARKPDGTLQRQPAKVTLAPVRGPTLDEIEARYGAPDKPRPR